MLARERAGGEAAFTLIEVLVVTILLGVLVSIAIPVYLSQREKAWDAATQSDLRNAKVALEAYYTATGSYHPVAVTTGAYGYSSSPNVELESSGITSDAYCVSAHHDPSGRWYSIVSASGALQGPYDTDPC